MISNSYHLNYINAVIQHCLKHNFLNDKGETNYKHIYLFYFKDLKTVYSLLSKEEQIVFINSLKDKLISINPIYWEQHKSLFI